jgi:hypothetical protein
MIKLALAAASALAVAAIAPDTLASTGVCDSNPPTTTTACIDAIQNGGAVVNDIFKDVNGLSGQQLPVFGRASRSERSPRSSAAPFARRRRAMKKGW